MQRLGIGNGNDLTVSPSQTVTYGVHATDANNCFSDTVGVTVSVLPALQAVLSDTIISCPKVDVLLTPDSVQGGDGLYMYNWGAGPSIADTLRVNLFSTQSYCVSIADGCETPPITRCVTVVVTPVPPLVLTVDSVLGCEPFTVQFALEDTTGGATADWNFNDGPTLINRPMTMVHTYGQHGVYDLRVNSHWPNGCSYDSTYADLITVIAIPYVDFNWVPYPATIFNNDVHFHELADGLAVNYEWDFGGLGTSTEPDPEFIFPDDIGRYYPVQLLVRNFLGCADSIMRTVDVDDAFLVYVPTAFTPDGDGLNDVLEVLGNDISATDYHLMIFDRYHGLAILG